MAGEGSERREAGELPRLPRRARDAHKGDLGRVLVIGGSRGLIGAPAMTAEAALRAGAGLVTIACPASVYPILAAKVTCPMTWPLPETPDETLAQEALEPILTRVADGGADVVAIGPGLGRAPQTLALVQALIERLTVPWVADADALLAIARDPRCLNRARAAGVLTPHPGEMGRLLGTGARAVQRDRAAAARAFSGRYPTTVLVLKGAGSIVIGGGGGPWTASTGNPGMATGGTGDVLTGVVAALVGQGIDPYDAARVAVHVHGRAGDLAAARWGERGLIATDVIEALPPAFQELERA